MSQKIKILLTFFCSLILTSAFSQKTSGTHNNFEVFFEQYQVDGSFFMTNIKNDTMVLYDSYELHKQYSPASTFKILNSLIALQTKVIRDENTIIKWDSIDRSNPKWNQDQDMKTAFKNSTVWFYQELARRIGSKRMKHWLNKVHYGNTDTSGGIDKFWLTGGLRITPQQQLDFLKRFYLGDLPFSKKNIAIVKKLMIHEQTDTYTLRGKTGWGFENGMDIGWFVGYLETKNNVYFFTTCIQNPAEMFNEDFSLSRTEITKNILKKLNLLPTL